MRIAIDLQSCQNADSDLSRATLALAQNLARHAGEHDLWIAFSNQFPLRMEALRAAFSGLLPAVRLVTYDTPAPDGSLRVQQTIALVRDTFFASLGVDLVFAPGMFDHDAGTVGAIGTQDQPFLTAVSVSTLESLADPHGAPPARAEAHARQQDSLRNADLLLAASAEVAAALHEAFAGAEVASIAPGPQGAAGLWDLFGQALARRPAGGPPPARLPLACISPLPPQPSGIADYSAELIVELDKYYDVHLIVPDPAQVARALGERFPVHDLAWFEANAARFERVLYHFGNSDVHWHMFGMLERHPGIVVLHDFFLSNVLDNLDRFGGVAGAFRKALFHSHGYTAMADHATLGHNPTIWKYPANKQVLDRASGVIVHSPYSVELSETWYGPGSAARWRILPLMRGAGPGAGRTAARAELGIGEDELLICSFGMLGATKLNIEVLDAFLALPASVGRCRLVFVGGDDPSEYGVAFASRVANSGRRGDVTVTGFVSAEHYRAYLEAADVAVQLRGMSRGETSASVLDCMLYGIATIVNANGSNGGLPRNAVRLLPDQLTQEQLSEALVALCGDARLRAQLGTAAREHVRTYHSPEAVGLQYADAIEAFATRSPRAHYRQFLGGMRALGAPTDARHHELVAAARAVAANQPPLQPRQLLVDVSAVVQYDLKTGIQRVVRSILLALIKQPPPGFRIEPVYGDGGNRRYRYARQFTLAMLGAGELDVEDAPIEHRPGDVFLGLDLVANITAQNGALLNDMRNHGVRVCFVMYDILPLLLPRSFPHGTDVHFREFVEAVAGVADGVVCISRAVADELADWIRTHGAPRASALEIDYFHLGADISASAPSTGMPENAEQVLAAVARHPTLLMVGTVEPRKGHEQALAAFELLWSQNIDANLVIVGKPGWMVEALIQKIQQHPELNRRLFWLTGASDEMLTRLYGSCAALLAASVAEGFGLPLIEAAQQGLPIVARNLPVFREVSGGHAYYFEGTEAADLADALRAWLALFAEGKAPQSAQMPWLTWADSARQLVEAVTGAGDSYITIPAAR